MNNVFAELRTKYFTLDRAAHFPTPMSATDPWGALMEIGYPEAVVTTVTFSDGTVSVLRSSGGGFFGGGDEGVQAAGREFLKQAQIAQPQAKLTADFPQPETGQVFFYHRADSGVFTLTSAESDLRMQSHQLYLFYCSGVRILHEYLRLQKQTRK